MIKEVKLNSKFANAISKRTIFGMKIKLPEHPTKEFIDYLSKIDIYDDSCTSLPKTFFLNSIESLTLPKNSPVKLNQKEIVLEKIIGDVDDNWENASECVSNSFEAYFLASNNKKMKITFDSTSFDSRNAIIHFYFPVGRKQYLYYFRAHKSDLDCCSNKEKVYSKLESIEIEKINC